MTARLRVPLRLGLALLLASSALIATAGAAGAGTAAGKPPVAFAGEFHRIENFGNGLCLQPQASPGTRIIQVGCNGSSEQGWLTLNDGNNRYRFLNGSGRGCMSLSLRPFNGEPVDIDNCTISDGSGRPVSNATWLASRALPDLVTLRTRIGNTDNNFCLDVPGGSGTPFLGVQVFRCNNSDAQRWLAGAN